MFVNYYTMNAIEHTKNGYCVPCNMFHVTGNCDSCGVITTEGLTGHGVFCCMHCFLSKPMIYLRIMNYDDRCEHEELIHKKKR